MAPRQTDRGYRPQGVESSERLGRRRWVIERTVSRLTGSADSTTDERHPRNYLAFPGLAAALCCYKRLVRLTAQGTA